MSFNFDQDVKDMGVLLEETSKDFEVLNEGTSFSRWEKIKAVDKMKIIKKLNQASGQFASNMKAFLDKNGKLSDEQLDALKSMDEEVEFSKDNLHEEVGQVNEVLMLIEEVEPEVSEVADSITEIYLNEEKGFGFVEANSKTPMAKTVLNEKTRFQMTMDLKDKYEGKWLKAKVLESRPSLHGKGYDMTFMLQEKDASDLPSIIETEMVEAKKEYKRNDKVQVQLYISAGGILVDKIK